MLAGTGTLRLTLPSGGFDGAEIFSTVRPRHRAVEARLRAVEARLRTADAAGSISAFFLYEGVRGGNDEIDVEIPNDDSRRIWFTVWVGGRRTHHAERRLAFDPRVGFHDYRIDWSEGRVRFLVDNRELAVFSGNVPAKPLFLMSNAWWPTWLSGPPPTQSRWLEIDRIVY